MDGSLDLLPVDVVAEVLAVTRRLELHPDGDVVAFGVEKVGVDEFDVGERAPVAEDRLLQSLKLRLGAVHEERVRDGVHFPGVVGVEVLPDNCLIIRQFLPCDDDVVDNGLLYCSGTAPTKVNREGDFGFGTGVERDVFTLDGNLTVTVILPSDTGIEMHPCTRYREPVVVRVSRVDIRVREDILRYDYYSPNVVKIDLHLTVHRDVGETFGVVTEPCEGLRVSVISLPLEVVSGILRVEVCSDPQSLVTVVGRFLRRPGDRNLFDFAKGPHIEVESYDFRVVLDSESYRSARGGFAYPSRIDWIIWFSLFGLDIERVLRAQVQRFSVGICTGKELPVSLAVDFRHQAALVS